MKCSDDELILYLYVELDVERYKQITKQLESDQELQRRLHALRHDLARITQSSTLDAAGARTPEKFTTGWHDIVNDQMVESDSRPESAGNKLLNWPLMGLAATLLLTLGFGFGYIQRGTGTPGEVAQTTEPVAGESFTVAPDKPDAMDRNDALSANHGVRAHLQNVQHVLSALDPAEAQQRRKLLQDILLQNELHQKLAQLQGADDLTRLLRAFEQSLLVIASQDSGEVYASREQLEFELDVVLTKLGLDTSNRQQSL